MSSHSRCALIIAAFVMLPTAPARADYCAAFQGNGQAVFGHFHSAARLLENFGRFDAAAGSSSATITMFLYESMLENPAIKDCDCTEQQKVARLSLMLKSLVGFYESRLDSEEAVALQGYREILDQLKAANDQTPAAEEGNAVLKKLIETLAGDQGQLSTYLGILFNPRFVTFFRESPNPRYHWDDFRKSQSKGIFQIDGPKVYMRPFPMSFDGLATVIGWVGNFYAARGYSQEEKALWDSWFKRCGITDAPAALAGKTWGQIAHAGYQPADPTREKFEEEVFSSYTPTECGKGFAALMAVYNARPKTKAAPTGEINRIDEPVGKHFRAMPITGVLVGKGASKMRDAMEVHRLARPDSTEESGVEQPKLPIDHDKEFRIGFFGHKQDRERVAQSVAQSVKGRNLKADAFVPLEQPEGGEGFSWRTAFQTSPAEPTIAEAFFFKVKRGDNVEEVASIGGWVDPQPTTLLKYAGCTQVAFVTAQMKVHAFPFLASLHSSVGGAARLDRWIEATDNSAYTIGLEDADAVWCTQWNKSRGLDLQGVYRMTEFTYNQSTAADDAFSNFEARTPFFQKSGLKFLENIARPSCSRPRMVPESER